MKADFLNKAKENLEVAENCYKNGWYNACANRAYYAAFQGAIAALADKEIKSDHNDHKWVHITFTSELIKRRKVYPAKLKSYLPDLQTIRNQADYQTKDVSKRLASKLVSNAKEMLKFIEKELIK